MLVKIEKFNIPNDCIEYDIIVNDIKVAYVVEYKDNSAEIYYDFEDYDTLFEDPRSSYVFDSIEDCDDFIYNQFER